MTVSLLLASVVASAGQRARHVGFIVLVIAGIAAGLAVTAGVAAAIYGVLESARNLVGTNGRVKWIMVSLGLSLIGLGYIAAAPPIWIAGIVVTSLITLLAFWNEYG